MKPFCLHLLRTWNTPYYLILIKSNSWLVIWSWHSNALIYSIVAFHNITSSSHWISWWCCLIFNFVTDESVIALANNCLHLRSLGLYYCQNITDRAMYSLAHSRVKNKHEMWESVKSRYEEEGLMNLNISQCTALTPPAVQALCDSFPKLHTCPGRHSLIISGCLNLTSVHCACAVQVHSTTNRL